MPIRALSLDLFDTLVDIDTRGGEAYRDVARALHAAVAAHVEIAADDFGQRVRDADQALRKTRYAEGIEVSTEERFTDILGRLGIDVPGLVDELTAIHMGMIRDHVAVPGHHAELLATLAGRGRVGLCSNFTHAATAWRVLREAGLDPHLDPVVISVDVGRRKPRREIFDALLAGLATPAEETLHVGDNLRADIEGAAALGMRTAWLTRRVPDPEQALASYDGPRPDFVIADLRELLELAGG